jgi:drug/metabolite transporter (DMT)-like permease
MVYADKSAPLSVAMPIMGMSVMVTAVIAVAFMGEPLTLKTVAGVLLAVIAIFLLAG